jgi:hypothetical protein
MDVEKDRVPKEEYKEVVKAEKKKLMFQTLILIALSAGVSIVFLSLLLANPQSTTTA